MVLPLKLIRVTITPNYCPMNCQIDGWGRTESSSRFRGVADLRTVKVVTLLPSINCSLYREQFDGEIMICAGDRVRKKRLQKIILLTLYKCTWASLYMDGTDVNFFKLVCPHEA